jgi:hypothetical protein
MLVESAAIAIEFQDVLRAARKTGARRRFLAEAEGALALS